MLWTIKSYALDDRKLCFGFLFLLLLENHSEQSLFFLIPFEVPLISISFLFTILAFNERFITLDVVENILVLAEELGWVSAEQLNELGNLGASEEQWVLAEELARVVERLQLGECLKITNAQFCHISYCLCITLFLQQFVELLHLAPGVDAVVINDGCHLHVRISKVFPVYFRVLFFFFFGVAGFFG
mgnify:CR=1 FL=1